MELALSADVKYRHHPQPLSPIHHRRRPSFNSIAFSKSSLTAIKASIQNETPKHQIPKFVTGATVAVFLLSRFIVVKPAIAASSPPPVTIDEKTLEEHHINAFKTIMEIKIKNGKFEEAIGMLNQLVKLEPERKLLKHTYRRDDDDDEESAKLGFETKSKLKNVEKRILEGMEICKKWEAKNHDSLEFRVDLYMGKNYIAHRNDCFKTWRKMDRIRDFKLVVAQILVIQGDYNEALKIYQELSEEEPEDFKPYLFQGMLYTLLGKKDDAENNFAKVEYAISGRLEKPDYIGMAVCILLLAIILGISIKSFLELYILKKE